MPKYRKPNRGRRAVHSVVPAPLGGLNGRDALADMPRSDAYEMDNWFPNNTSMDMRSGSTNFATGLGAAVDSIEVFRGSAGSKMLAFAGGKVYNTTAGGVPGAPLLSAQVSSKVTSCMFSNAGSQFLLVYSGADAPFSYDGTTLAGLVITGLTGSQNLIFAGMSFKGRVLLAQTGQLGFYYLAVGAIQGAASYFDLQQQSLYGGSLAAICSFSQSDSGASPEDYALFVTTEGEYIVYKGTDPSSAANWQLVGRYTGPPPIGKKGWFRFRGEVYFITEEGILSISQIREGGEDVDTSKYLSSKLGRHYSDVANSLQSTHGWCGIMYPRGKALLINVPSATTKYAQFIMNTSTGAWGKYSGWDGKCFALFGRRLYFGTADGRVMLADEGLSDNNTPVTASCRQAWDTFDDKDGMGDEDKQFHFVTLSIQVDSAPYLAVALNINYEEDVPTAVTGFIWPDGAKWDTATWDVDYWAASDIPVQITVPVDKVGYAASLWLRASSTTSKVQWFSSRFTFEKLRGVLVQ